MSDSVRPHRRPPTRLLCPWDSPGKNTGVGCHFLLQCMKVKSESEVAQLYPTLSNLMDCSLPGSSVHGIFQARVLEWGAIAFSYLLLVKHQNHTCQCLGWFLCQKIGKFPCALVTKPNLGLPTQSSTAKPIYWHQIVVKGSTTLMQDTNKSMGSKCS